MTYTQRKSRPVRDSNPCRPIESRPSSPLNERDVAHTEVSAGVEPALYGLQPYALPLGDETEAPTAGFEPALSRLTAGRLTSLATLE